MFKCLFAKRTVDEREKRKYDHGVAGHTWSTYDASSMVVYYYLSPRDWPKYAIQPEVSASLRIFRQRRRRNKYKERLASFFIRSLVQHKGPFEAREGEKACHRVSMRAPTTH